MAPTPNQLPDSSQPQEEEYDYQAPPTNPGSSQHYAQPMTYHPQSAYYPSTSMPYLQPIPQRGMAQAPYTYQPYSSVPVPPATELAEHNHSTTSYVGSYGVQNQPPVGSQRSDPYYYAQSTGAPVTPTTESSYSHQYMPYRQAPLTLSYPETNPTSTSLPSPGTHSSQRLTSPERPVDEQRARSVDEVNYGSIANNYRYIAATVSQASPSPSTDSSGQSFDPPVVEDMFHRAVEGLRHLDPSRAEQYYPSESGSQVIASGAVAAEAPAETVFVRYYEDGKTEGNPMKKKRERKGATQCASCHATSTPEWRRGPLGPRTLCNACGLVYAKLMKKRAKEEDRLSLGESPRRARSKGKTRAVTEESEEDRGTEQGSDDTLPPSGGPSGAMGGGYPP